MQRKFKVVDPNKDINIAKWVSVSSNSQNASTAGSPRITLTSRPNENTVVISPHCDVLPEPTTTPTSVKILRSPVFFKDTSNVLRTNRRPKQKSNTKKFTDVRASAVNLEPQIVTPKVICSPGIVRDTKDWRLDTSRNSIQNVNSAGISQRSFVSGSGEFLESSRTLFKPEIRQNVDVSNWVTVVSDTKIAEDDCRIPPSFSARTEEENNLQTENMSETVLQPRKQSVMSNKVGDSRKEIEKLKTELETLISTNLKNKNIISQQSVDTNIENIPTTISLNNLTSVVKQNVIVSPPKTLKSPSSVRRKSSTLITSDTNVNKEEQKSKARTYDPESTREFIKRQKLRRKEKFHQEELKKKEIEEFKKQKLEDLKQKTLQLVSENVKKSGSKKICAKRSEENLASKSNAQLVNNKSSQHLLPTRQTRARSFDRQAMKQCKVDIQENVDKAKEKLWQRSRSVSRELKVCDKKSPVNPRKSVHENKPNSKNTISNAQAELDQVVNKISHLLNNELDDNKDEAAFRGFQQRSKSSQNPEPLENIKSNTSPNTNNIHSENYISKEIKSNIPSEIVIENSSLPKQKINISSDKIEISKNVISSNVGNLEEIIKNIPEEIIKSSNQSQKQKQKDVIKFNVISHKKDVSPVNEDSLREIEIIKQKLETSISQSNLENKRNDTPAWLLPPSTLPYPYNFISAVRKKLEIATKSPSVANDIKLQSPNTEKFSKDTSIQTLADNRKSNVSIQCSLENSREIKELSTPEIVPPKPEELRTFMSHKCRKQLVYDTPPKIQSPNNINKEIKSQNEKKEYISVKSKSKTVLTSDASDSDTTKNIPEISEEEQFSKHYSVKSDLSANLKNITFHRANAEDTTNGKNFTFDQIKVDKNSSNHESKKLSIKSEYSDRLKNISFDRRTNNSSLDISNLIKPDYKMDTSKISKHNIEHQSNRSKYPSDIDSILTQYSKMKSSSKSNIHNESHISQYSEDFNSSSTNHLSLPHTKLSDDKIKQENGSSLDIKTESRKHISKAGSSDLSKIKSEILASLARQHSSSLSNIPKQISESLSNRISEFVTNDSTDSLNKISNGSNIDTRNSTKNTLESRTRNSLELNSNNTSANVESLNKNSSNVTEIKTKNSNSSNKNYSELNSKVSEIKNMNSRGNNLESPDKYFSKLNSETNNSKIDNSVSNVESQIKHASETKSDVSEIKSIKSNESQIKTNPSNSISHSKKEASVIASSIPEDSVALKTDSQSAQESNIIKSSINESLKQRTESVTDSEIQSTNENFENSVLKSSNVHNLSKPTVNLKIEKEKFFRETKNNPNQIHLKFQAEVHLLNSFNNSLQQVVAVEKSLLDINNPPASSVNFTRGCGVPDHIESLSVLEPSVCSQDLAMSRLSDSVASETGAVTEHSVLSETCSSLVSRRESAVTKNPYVGVSLGMFDQMIRDEDNRLEHLKAILKLRDKALFDRTKGELAWLEIQKKQLRENGQLNDVTIIKKKQRGLIIKLEQERHEMQRLKQAHKQAAKERKNALREQKNIIKQQLSSTDQIPTKIRRLSHLERRQSGPVKVYRVESRTEHVKETTMSKNSSGTDETISMTTSSVVTQISEKVSVDHSSRPEASLALKLYPNSSVVHKEKVKSPDKHSEKVKRALLMKEADLEKRRKEAEELLKWHERLKQEEAQVVELERQAKSIPLDDHEKKRVLTGAQLNKIWKGITGSVEKKFDDHKKYQMSKRSLDKFYQNARKIFKEISEERNSSKRGSEESYTSDFDLSHSPSKNNVSSSLMTQINETDFSISPNKMLSDRLRKISESSRIDFITSIKSDTDISEHSTVSEDTQLSTDKKSIISEILSVDQQNVTDSNIQILKDSSIHSAEDKTSSKSSVISELNVISNHESIASKKSIPSEIKSRKSSTEPDIPSLQIISDREQNTFFDTKESVQSVEEQVINSNTDSDLPELQIASDLDQNTEEIKSSLNKESFQLDVNSKNSSTDSDLPGLEIDSELDIHLEHTKSADIIYSVAEKSNKFSKNSESQNKSEYGQISTKSIEESLQSVDENKFTVISENSHFQNISEIPETPISVSDEIDQEFEFNKSPRIQHDSQILSVIESVITDDERNKIDSDHIITDPGGIKSKLSSNLQLETKTENISPEENIHSENLTSKGDKNISISFKEIISAEISPETIKSEENTSKNFDENILLPSDSHVLSDVEVKSEINTSSQIDDISGKVESTEDETEQISGKKSDLEESASAKSSDLQDSSTIQSYTLVDNNISNNKSSNSKILSDETKSSIHFKEANQESNVSENTNLHSDIIKLTVLSDQISPKLSIQSDITSNSNIKCDLLIDNVTIQSSKISNKSSENQDTNIDSEVEKRSVETENKSSLHEEKLLNSEKSYKSVSDSQDTNIISKSDKDLIDSDIKSKLEELEIKSSTLYEELNDSNSKSEEIESNTVESIVDSAEVSTKTKSVESIIDLTEVSTKTFIETKSNNETEEQNLIHEPETNIQSEVSTLHESEPYYQTDFEKISENDFTSETDQQTKKSNEETEIDQDLTDSEAKENTESIKSSFSIETEKESITKIESPESRQFDIESNSETKDNSGTFESEKESATIIESPKSIQTVVLEIKSISSSSESQVITNLSQKSLSTEGEESVDVNKDSSEHSVELQNEDANLVGVSHIDVRKRVSEILADTTVSRGDKSPRLQDLYVTTYDVMTNSPESTPETGSPTNECNKRDKSSATLGTPYRTEAEELLRKQLEIEQEIKQLERQQQNLPYLFMREIPNKPPPPYKPPNAPLTPVINSVIPVHAEQIRRFVNQSADVLFEAYVTGNLKEASYKCNEDDKVNTQKYIFDLCKEIALEVCKPMETIRIPSWKSQKNKFQTLISKRPLNKEGLCSVMNRKVLQLLNFEPVVRKDNLIIRWSRKKRDHVDEILVLESQTEETEWTNYDSDEQTIKDNLTSDIMNMLILETAQVMCEILKKKKNLLWTNYC